MNGPLTLQIRADDQIASELVGLLPPALAADQRSGAWVFEAAGKYARLHLDATDAAARGLVRHEQIFRHEVCEPLAGARTLMTKSRGSISPKRWWTGCEIEEAWRLLHQAEAGLLLAVNDDEVVARSRGVLASSRAILTSKDERIAMLEKSIGDRDKDAHAAARPADVDQTVPAPDALRRAVVAVVHGRHQTTDALHQLTRSYRNTILTASASLAGLAGVLILLQSVADFTLFDESSRVGLGPTEFLVFVMFFGCLGAVFSAAPSIATQPKSASPYAVARQQVIFKVAVGAWSAIIGLLAVTTGLVTPNTGETAAFGSLAALAMIAAVFGAAQEAMTRFADRKVRDVLDPTATE